MFGHVLLPLQKSHCALTLLQLFQCPPCTRSGGKQEAAESTVADRVAGCSNTMLRHLKLRNY